MINITLPQVREAMAAVVAERGPDFVYNPCGLNSCRYLPLPEWESTGTDDPRLLTGCLVGAVLQRLGIPPASMDINGTVEELREHLWTRGVADWSPEVEKYLWSAQWQQDYGNTWGDALSYAEAVYAEA